MNGGFLVIFQSICYFNNMINHFDYSKVPMELIYENRRHLDDFGVEDETSINHFIEKRLSELFCRYDDYEDFATSLFNEAYYICTAAQAERYPHRRFGSYRRFISKQISQYDTIIYSIVILQMRARGWNNEEHKSSRLYKLILDEISQCDKNEYYYIECDGLDFLTRVNSDLKESKVKVTLDTDFKPREITPSLLNKYGKTWDYIYKIGNDTERIREIVFALGKNEDEQKILLNYFRNIPLITFNSELEKQAFFADLDNEVYEQNHPEEVAAKRKAEQEDFEAYLQDEALKEIEQEHYRTEYPKLKTENEELRQQVEQLKKQLADRPAVENEKDVSDEQVKELKEEIELLKKEIENLETRNGIDTPKAALLVRIACSNIGGLPRNRGNAWPLIQNIWGGSESNARKRLKESVKKETIESLAKLIEGVSPKIADIIKQEGKKILIEQKEC